ncbi:DUF3568 family protein [Roseateles violae]|uniref:Uncharacterized protein n=1 Tax=Roseateles violae TaxID=3058042 RepID=A0ABT8DTY4_9BURK|nr:DUF3568 family protein [Pelomonas sp. PFR6]MDN3919636.1 hypothetical protein [Pelomonas sp. PFR6]
MRRLPLLAAISALVASSALLSGCYTYPYGYPSTVSTPASFDRSWDAALGAANDAGVQVTSADRASGRIRGNKAGAAVYIDLNQQADGSLKVAFNAPDAKESNPTLQERWTAAYNRRMGR